MMGPRGVGRHWGSGALLGDANDAHDTKRGANAVGDRGEVVTATGRGAGERWLLREVDRALAAAVDALASDANALAHPVRVVVPSHSLRLHVATRIATLRGRAAVGLRIQTLGALALEILERAGAAPDPPALFPVLVRREARREPALTDGLDALVDGYGPVVGAVDDLLEAGFESAHADVLLEHLSAQPATRGVLARARAVVRVAARVAATLDRPGIGHRSRLLVRAREQLEADPARLPFRTLFVYGFSDATGVQADLLAALLRRDGVRLVLDAPRDPFAGDDRPAGPRYGAAFRERLAAYEHAATSDARSEGGAVRVVRARTFGAEARDVARRLRALLDAGVTPERIGVVARDLAPYRLPLRQHLTRLFVPFSGVDAPGVATAARRRLDALLALVLDDPPGMEPWLSAREGLGGAARADLRQALHRRGALRLDEVAALAGSASDDGVRLAARRRLAPPQADADRDDGPVSIRRVVAGDELAAAGRAAEAVLRRLARRPQLAAIRAHADWLEALVREDLLWHDGTPGFRPLAAALDALPHDAFVDRAELGGLLQRALDGAGVTPIGGAGGGVQVLAAMEARARSFDHLFVLGMSRGAFPRTIVEDPMLPDAIRARLREVLPDLAVKRDGFDEERFLFAQLLEASEDVTLSLSETNVEGRPLPPSPLLESLERTRAVEHEAAPPLHAPATAAGALPGSERALLAGLYGTRPEFAQALASATREALLGSEAGLGADEVAAARLAILDEIEPADGRRSLLGPYFGFVGAPRGAADPRRGPLFVTRLEQLARCPWQVFLTRMLGLAPPPDAAHELPAANDPRLIGNVVHAVLDRIAGHSPGDPSDAGGGALAREARPAPWPDDATLDGWIEAAAAEQVRDDAKAMPGFARVLARLARPFLLRARACDWDAGPPSVVGTEVKLETSVRDASGAARAISFRADRVDRRDGHLVLTDYKTGKAIAPQKTPRARADALRREVASGKALQAMLYARAGGEGAVGRYLFLREDAADEARSLELEDEPFLGEPFDAAIATLIETLDRGSFLPRVRLADKDEEPGACRTCEVKDACVRGDSGARLRLERWFERDGARRGFAERAAAGIYTLGTDA